MIEPNTEIKIEYTSDGALYLSMWRRGRTRGGIAVVEELPQEVRIALAEALQPFITKGANDASSTGKTEGDNLAIPA